MIYSCHHQDYLVKKPWKCMLFLFICIVNVNVKANVKKLKVASE